MSRLLAALGLLLALFAAPAHAGRACGDTSLTVEDARRAFTLAHKVRQALDDSGAQIALLARVGQDLSSYGLRYSHLGIVWRDHPQGRWLVVHELNECGTALSTIYNQGLANFFADDLFDWEALLLIPTPEIQTALAARFQRGEALALHQPNYNMVAFPFSDRYQNSNQWALEFMAPALAGKEFASRAEAQRWLREAGYQPSTLRIRALSRLGGRMFRANVAFDDHPGDRRAAGMIDTVTVESMVAFLQQRKESAEPRRIRLDVPPRKVAEAAPVTRFQ